MPTPSLLSWCCNMQDSLMLGEMHDFAAQWLWYFLEMGEESEQFQERSCILHNNLFYKEILSTARPLHPQDGTGKVMLLPLGPF